MLPIASIYCVADAAAAVTYIFN